MNLNPDNDNSNKGPRRTYLVTCSQIDLSKFPTRKMFGDAVASAFESGSGKVKAEYWATCLEEHENGGHHYHTSVKLSSPKRWLSVKNNLDSKYEIQVHFSMKHDNYYSAYKYVCKSDDQVYHSENHPNLKEIGSPKTKACIGAYRQKRKSENTNSKGEGSGSRASKIKRLTKLDVSDFLVEHKIKTEDELLAVAHQQKVDGKKELANFVINQGSKALQDLIVNSWRMQNAVTNLNHRSRTRMELINEASIQACVEECNGKWLGNGHSSSRSKFNR